MMKSIYNFKAAERDELIRSIQLFEKQEKSGDRGGEEWQINPSPDVSYHMHLEYLSKLCDFM